MAKSVHPIIYRDWDYQSRLNAEKTNTEVKFWKDEHSTLNRSFREMFECVDAGEPCTLTFEGKTIKITKVEDTNHG